MNENVNRLFKRDVWSTSRALLKDLHFISYDNESYYLKIDNNCYELRIEKCLSALPDSTDVVNIKEKILKTEIKNDLFISIFNCNGKEKEKVVEQHGLKKHCNLLDAYGDFIEHNVNGYPSYIEYNKSNKIYSVNWAVNGHDFTDKVAFVKSYYDSFDLSVCLSKEFREIIELNLKI